jgi:hypothetical protein
MSKILEEFRMGWAHDPIYGARNWLQSFDDPNWGVESIRSAGPDEIERARKVLIRLAAMDEIVGPS